LTYGIMKLDVLLILREIVGGGRPVGVVDEGGWGRSGRKEGGKAEDKMGKAEMDEERSAKGCKT